MLVREWVLLIGADLVVVIGVSVLIGMTAPRWHGAWLRRDALVLHRLPWETPAFFRRLRVTRWATRLPELGGTFGGQSKDALPGSTTEALEAYLVEVRRAEWVHWGSVLGSLILFAFNPWWLATAFVLVVSLGNLPFLVILRNNRFRIQRILDSGRRSP